MSWMDIMDSASSTVKPTTSNSWLDSISGYAKNGMNFLNTNKDALSTLGTLASGYMTYDMANKQYDMQKQAFDYNKLLSEREKKRQENAENQLALGFSNSSLSGA